MVLYKMNTDKVKLYQTAHWYHELADHTFPTSFVKLNSEELCALADGQATGDIADEVQERLKLPMGLFPGNCFVFTDTVAPTDTERFEGKRGAVYSPKSAWLFLTKSDKVKTAAANGEIEHLCVRPFRRMSKPREFRLFIQEGQLKAMSQYWLIRHYRRLEGRKDFFWKEANKLVDKISWLLPDPNIVMDIYFTSDNQILIIDFNPWGEPTNPLIFRTWERDWNVTTGITLIEPPVKVGGDVNVSF
jgi:D123 protein